jgi:hypothetical protein
MDELSNINSLALSGPVPSDPRRGEAPGFEDLGGPMGDLGLGGSRIL